MNVTIHVGFSRTGTTTLQRHLFSRHPEIHYLGKPYGDDLLGQELEKLMEQESTRYESTLLKNHADKFIRGRKLPAGKKMALVSDERLVSYSKVRDRGLTADRLKETLRPCRILFTIRSQFDTLRSAYLSRGRFLLNVPPRYSGRFVGFDEWLALGYDHMERSYIGHLDYVKTIDYYSRLFGRDKLLVLPLEELINDKNLYIRKLTGFLGIDFSEAVSLVGDHHEHRDIDGKQLDMERLYRRWHPLSKSPPVSIILRSYFRLKYLGRRAWEASPPLPEGWAGRLSELYRDGNRKLAQDFGLPLKQYGYP